MLLKEEGNALFNDALSIFYLLLFCIGHMVKHHSDSDTSNSLPFFILISSKGIFICIIPHTGLHAIAFDTPVVKHWQERENNSICPT